MHSTSSIRFGLLSVAFALSIQGIGCNDSEGSKAVGTEEISASYTATVDGSGATRVVAALRTQGSGGLIGSSSRFVELQGRDRLAAAFVDPATGAQIVKRMDEERSGVEVRYSATFPDDDKDWIVQVAFERRGKGRTSARDSVVTLPTPFVLDWVEDPITMDPAPISFSRSSAVPYFVVWDPFDGPDFEPGDELRAEVTGTCIQTYRDFIDWQSGEDVLPLKGVLSDAPPPNDAMGCPIRIELTLSRRGSTDPAFEAGSFFGEQVRLLTLMSTP